MAWVMVNCTKMEMLTTMMENVNPDRPKQNFISHPLIHTFPPKSSTQNVEKRKAEPKTPHFLGINQDIVA